MSPPPGGGHCEITEQISTFRGADVEEFIKHFAAVRDVELDEVDVHRGPFRERMAFTARGTHDELRAFWGDVRGWIGALNKTTDWSDGIPLDDYRGRGGWPEIRPTLLPALPRAPARIRDMRAGLVVAGFRPGEEEADDGERVAVLESDAVEVLFARGRRGGWRVELSLPDWDEWYPADAVLTALGPEHDAAGLLASLDALAAANPEVLLARVTARDAGREMHP